ncbi:MAG: RagB/SusD family nutrient uptake outer membrane protein [Bacteroidota bacterium]
MKQYSYFIAFLLMLIVFSSCNKYLDQKSNNGIVTPTTLQDLQAVLDNGTAMNVKVTPSSGEGSADDYFLLQADFNARGSWEEDVYRWIFDDNYSYVNDWSSNYAPIYNSNFCLDEISTIPVTSANQTAWNNVEGSALFYRSYYFLQLAWTYANAYDEATSATDLGIALRLTSDFNVPSTRASVKDCYNRIIDDTKKSLLFLPDNPQHPYRPSRAAAYGLLARAYLSMRNYDSAWKYSDLCLQLKNHLINFNGDPDFNGATSSTPIKQFNGETIFYTEMSINYVPAISVYAKIDTSLYSSYATNDIRKVAFFAPIGNYQKFKGDYTGSLFHFTGIATDEILLTRAECYARRGDKSSALNDLNTLLLNRYNPTFLPLTAADANDALNKILIERRKELLMRGLRFIDLKRLNKGGANITLTRAINGQTYTLSPNGKGYALPLPRDIINLTGIPQNPQ